MAQEISFTLDGIEVTAAPDETIWQVAERHGIGIPHLCYLDQPGYRADGNCRACMVDVEGERVLAASCIRKPAEGMVVKTDTERAEKSRKLVFELLASNMRPAAEVPDNQSNFWRWAASMGISGSDRYASKFDGHLAPEHDVSNPAIAVNLDACISCNACVRACLHASALQQGTQGAIANVGALRFKRRQQDRIGSLVARLGEKLQRDV